VLRVHGEWSERNDLALAQAAEKIKILEEKLQSRVTKETEIQTDPQPSKTRIIKKPAPITASAGTQTDAHDEFDCVSTGSDEPLHRVKSDNGSNAGSAPQKQASQGFWSAIFGFSQKPAEPTTDASLKT
ncbi:MAG TPA: hypothetical protein VI844_01660, partial [Coxiellaceae bacterium]|nr:hypothetical protein [Coxiellaceae bacterium]